MENMKNIRETYRKGWATEYRLVQKLWDYGFFAMRSPASGRRCKRIFYPDVIAVKNSKIFFFEVKYLSFTKGVFIERRKFEKMKKIATRAGAKYYIAVFYRRKGTFYIVDIEDYDAISEKLVAYHYAKITRKCPTLEEFLIKNS